VPIGASLLSRLDPDAFRLGMGVLLLVFSTSMLLRRSRAGIAWGGRAADAVIGLGGGILGGLAGLSGPLPTMSETLRGWGKDRRSGVFQAFNLTILAAHAAGGFLTREVGWLALCALPGTLGGAWLGARPSRLSDRRFQEVVLYLLGHSGLTLIWWSLTRG